MSTELAILPDSQSAFYDAHAWCLDPLLPLSSLVERCHQEFDLLRSSSEAWQRQECRINLYLLASAVSSTVADYLGPSIPSFELLTKQFPRMKPAIEFVETLVHAVLSARGRFSDLSAQRWRERWDRCLDLACRVLILESEAHAALVSELGDALRECDTKALPRPLVHARAQLPSGFRAQDLSHYDVLSLAEEFGRNANGEAQAVAIVGARTAGSYFAPLIASKLIVMGWPEISWMSVRPKSATSPWEAKALRSIARSSSRVVVVDDHPDTGHTIHLMLKLLDRFRISRDRVTILVPSHPAQKDRGVLSGRTSVQVITEPWERSHKVRFLQAGANSVLQEAFALRGWEGVRVDEDSQVAAFNQQLIKSCGDGFYTHLKKVFSVTGRHGNRSAHAYVFAKSTGWGWLGYHGFVAGKRLEGFVPPVVAYREGILFSEWLGSLTPAALHASCAPTPEELAAYVARRAEVLPLAEDPCFDGWRYGSTGWYVLLRTLRAPFGSLLSRLKIPAIWRSLRKYVPRSPTFIDARMKPEEWIRSDQGIHKLDYEHHGFGNPALNVVDPAHDLAVAVFSLGLTQGQETAVIRKYQALRSDPDLPDRLILHKLMLGRVAEEAARYKFARADSMAAQRLADHNRLNARDFLVHHMNQFFANRYPVAQQARWLQNLCFIDLDGVFDRNRFYFPHTTPAGMQALRKLQAAGFSVVVNSGRSVKHIRDYSSTYSLCGGIGEYGCVFLDAINNVEHSLVAALAQEQLEQLRNSVATLDGVFSDPTYLYAARIYRSAGTDVRGLTSAEASQLLKPYDQLTFLTTSVDTYIIPKDAGKGRGVGALKTLVKQPINVTAGIGDDARFDSPMLNLVDHAYFLSNGSSDYRSAGLDKHVKIVKPHFQKGLLAAVNNLLQRTGVTAANNSELMTLRSADSSHIIEDVLRAGERPWWRQLWSLFDRQAV